MDRGIPVRCQLGALQERAVHDQHRVRVCSPRFGVDGLVCIEIERLRPDHPVTVRGEGPEQQRHHGIEVAGIPVIPLGRLAPPPIPLDLRAVESVDLGADHRAAGLLDACGEFVGERGLPRCGAPIDRHPHRSGTGKRHNAVDDLADHLGPSVTHRPPRFVALLSSSVILWIGSPREPESRDRATGSDQTRHALACCDLSGGSCMAWRVPAPLAGPRSRPVLRGSARSVPRLRRG